MTTILRNIVSYGVHASDDFYFTRLKRAINILALNAIFCISIAICYGLLIEGDLDAIIMVFSLPIYFSVFYLNKKDKAHVSITIMFVISALLLTFYSLRSGEASLVHMLFVLNIIGLAALYRKGRIRVYYFANLFFTLFCLGFVLVSFEFNWFQDLYDTTTNHALDRKVNMGFLVFCSILFSIVVVDSFSKQFSRLRRSADDKDILLAELNHRVKNNLSIIVSLLRLKQELSESEETKNALRDVGNRIHSMALVHRQMYEGEGKSVISVPSYVDDLMDGICQSLGDHPNISCNKKIEDLSLDVSSAIPIGMILNELIMNSLKHAFEETDAPFIGIQYERLEDGRIRLFYEDNGIGMDESDANLGESLGLEIIHSLTEQLDGKCEFYNRGGLKFELFFEERSRRIRVLQDHKSFLLTLLVE